MTDRIIRNEHDLAHNVWLPFPGYEQMFEITANGRVRSLSRLVNSPAAGGQRRIKGRILKPSLVKGYRAIQPNIGGKRKTLYLHRAIAELFVPNPSAKPCVNHIDGDKQNNSPDNLEWCTHLENMQHAYRTGLAKAPESGPGEMSRASKLTDADVVDIKIRLGRGETQKSISEKYGVSKGTIGFIARGETWSHIEVD